jgi:hypothetical protein
VGEVGLWIAAVLTIMTGYDYLRASLVYFERKPAPPRRHGKGPTPPDEVSD